MKRTPLDGIAGAAAEESEPGALVEERSRLRRVVENSTRFRRGDKVAGLVAAKLALSNHESLPRPVAEWLSNAIGLYLAGRRKSLDAALGLIAPGRASPLRSSKEGHALRAVLSRMYFLNWQGATIPQAAALVASLSPDWSAATLEAHYRRGGYTAALLELKRAGLPATDPEPELAEYPDRMPGVKEAKRAIRAMYAKSKV